MLAVLGGCGPVGGIDGGTGADRTLPGRLRERCGAVRLEVEGAGFGDPGPESRVILAYGFEEGPEGWRAGPRTVIEAAGGALHARGEGDLRLPRSGGEPREDTHVLTPSLAGARFVLGVRVDLEASRTHAVHLTIQGGRAAGIVWAWNTTPRPPDSLEGHGIPLLPDGSSANEAPGEAGVTVSLVLEDRPGWRGRIRWCGLVGLAGGPSSLALDEVRLVEVPFARRLAARLAAGEEGVGPLGGERRRALALAEGVPRRVVLPAGHGAGRLRLAFASPSLPGHTRARFAVRLTAMGSPPAAPWPGARGAGSGGAGEARRGPGIPGPRGRRVGQIVLDPGRGGTDGGWRELAVDLLPWDRWIQVDVLPGDRGTDPAIGLVEDGAWWIPRRPEGAAPILFLLTVDTLRADALSVYGQTAIRTEAFERLAREGACFAEAYTVVNATTPSHATMFTGLYPKDHGVYDNHSQLASGVPTLAAILRANGWRTVAVTSVPHLNPDRSGLGQGFDVFHVCPPGVVRDGEESAAIARGVLAAEAGVPLFLWLHLFDPHTPYHPPPDLLDGVPAAPIPRERIRAWLEAYGAPPLYREIPDYGEEGAVMLYVRRYLGEVLRVDRILAGLLDVLDTRGARDRTLLVVVADHGESLGEHGVWFGHGGLYQPVVRVPLLVRGPGIPAGTRPLARVDTLSLLPAFLEAAGIREGEAGGRRRGRSLLEAFEGSPRGEPPRPIFFEHANREGVGFLLGSRKAIRIDFPPEALEDPNMPRLPARSLYDLETDPGEAENLAPTHDAAMKEALARIARWLEDREGWTAVKGTLTADEKEQLEQLGYR